MKRIITTMWCLVAIAVQAQDHEQEVESKIRQVTVYLEGAQVSRQARVNLQPGVTTLRLGDIAPGIMENSIQVEPVQDIKILAVSFRVNHLNTLIAPDAITSLEAERRRLLSLVAKEKSVEEVYREEEVILKTNKSIGSASKGVNVEELKVAMDYFRQRLLEIRERLLEADRNIRRYNEAIGKIEAQLTELNSRRPKPEGEITIKVSSRTATAGNFNIKYLVKEAKWLPSYDIRVKDIQSPVSIAYKANITQQTGEDWEKVEMTISSGNPAKGGARPSIQPWHLGFNNTVRQSNTIATIQQPLPMISSGFVRGRVTDESGAPVPGANIIVKGTTIGTVTDAEGFYSIPVSSGDRTLVASFIGMRNEEVDITNKPVADIQLFDDVTQLSEVVVTAYGVESRRSLTGSVAGIAVSSGYSAPRIKRTLVATPVVRQINVEYVLEENLTVKSDGETRSTEMVEYELDALYEYYCVPKLDPDAFLVAKVINWDAHNFLEGEASLFFEGKYVGKSLLDTRNTSDTLSLSLGRDGNVLVKREKNEDLSSRQFVGANQKVALGYEISIRNKKAQPLTIVIEDQMPIPNTKEIDVDKIEDSDAAFEPDTGLLKWRKVIAPGTTESILLRYSIRYPKYSQLILE